MIMVRLIYLNFKKNWKRFLSMIVGVSLSCMLLFLTGFLYSTFDEYRKNEILKNSPFHVTFSSLTKEQVQIIKQEKYKEVFFENRVLVQEFNDIEFIITSFSVDYESYLTLKEGRFPSNEKEIVVSNYFYEICGKNLNDYLEIGTNRYMIVGVYTTSSLYFYDEKKYGKEANAYYAYTSFLSDINYAHLIYDSKEDVLENINHLASKLGLPTYFDQIDRTYKYENTNINYSLLTYQGIIEGRKNYSLILLFLLLLFILTIFCSLNIYNIFSVSVLEKKQFYGRLASIGATPFQIRNFVLKEALFLFLLSVPLGLILAYFLSIFLLFMLKNIIYFSFVPTMVTMDNKILIFIIFFSLLVVLLSSLFPALRAGRTSPIALIQMNHSFSKKPVKTKLLNKVGNFPILYAYKNIKGNVKKYRVCMISIILSIVLFLTMTTYLQSFFAKIEEEYEPLYDVSLSTHNENLFEDIFAFSSVEKGYWMKSINSYFQKIPTGCYQNIPYYLKDFMTIVTFDKEVFELLNEDNLKLPILMNETKILLENDIISVPTYYPESTFEISFLKDQSTIFLTLSNFTFVEERTYNGYFVPSYDIIVSSSQFQEFEKYSFFNPNYEIRLFLKDGIAFEEELQTYLLRNNILKEEIQYQNIYLENEKRERFIDGFRYFIYICIFLIAFVGFTSAFNTIYTSLLLRQKEFVILRSIGIEKKGIYKIFGFEAFWISSRAILFGIIAYYFIYYLSKQIQTLATPLDFSFEIIFPTVYVFIAFLLVFLILFLSYFISYHPIVSKNIVDEIKKENNL